MTKQTAGDLRTLVARRAGLKQRVALLVADAALAGLLRDNGCEVLEDPASLEELTAFAPQVVVAFDGFASDSGEGFRRLAQAAPQAQLLFSFANAASAGALLNALLGGTPHRALSETDVRDWLARAGYAVSSRDVVVTPRVPLKLAAGTEAALRQLLEQLNPSAAADRLLLLAAPPQTAAQHGAGLAPLESGLTSVVISCGDDAGALGGTLRSLVNQPKRPLELVVVSLAPEHQLNDALAPARGRAGVTLTVLHSTQRDALAQTNEGVLAARGQYLALLHAGELLSRTHLASLLAGLEAGVEAWALHAPEARFVLREWLDGGAVQRGRAVLDRHRLGAFALTFAEGEALAEPVFFARLAALFPPALVAGASGLDSPRVIAPAGAALTEALAGRPLRTLTELPLARGASLEAVLDAAEALLKARGGQARRAASLLARLRRFSGTS